MAAGLPYWECIALCSLAVIEALLGRHEDCEEHAQRALELAPRVGALHMPPFAWYALGISALTSGRVDDGDRSTRALPRDLRRSAAVDLFVEPDLIDA